MRDDLEQQEQVDALRGFWRDHRRWILGLVILVAASVAGYQGFQAWQSSRAQAATRLLERMETALRAEKLDEAEANGLLLIKDYSTTTHAALAGLRMAKAHVAAGAPEKALPLLAHAAKSDDKGLAWIAKVRAAAVLMDLSRFPEALTQLDGTPPASAVGMVEDRRGDVLVLMQRWGEARAAWEAAQKAMLSEADGSRSAELVARKLASLDAFAQTGQ